jgi:hypothetical protein
MAAAQLGNGWFQQHQISTWLSRVEPDDCTPLCGECETFPLAIHILNPPRIEQRSGTAARR